VSQPSFRYVFLGLSITSSWGNGHATTYRALLRQLAERGHEVTFLERDLPFYAANRDLPAPSYARTLLYGSLDELVEQHRGIVREADLVVVGSYVPDGALVGAWVQETAPGRAAFYDIDTPITLAKLAAGEHEYLTPALVARYALYLSFTGGPTLETIRSRYGAPLVRPLYCSADVEQYHPESSEASVDLGYLGTYSLDRQPAVEEMLFVPARRWSEGRFLVAGAQYPEGTAWPANVVHTPHVEPAAHRRFYGSQRFTLNVTRPAMAKAGWSPSVRLFEAAACGTAIITDAWHGLDEVLEPGIEVLVAHSGADVMRYLRETSERDRRALGRAARTRFLAEHTAMHRAETLERYTRELAEQPRRARVTASTQPRVTS
jgi:spore maturation protein CgeB